MQIDFDYAGLSAGLFGTIPKVDAATVTFEVGAGAVDSGANTYTEAGMVDQVYGATAQGLLDAGVGNGWAGTNGYYSGGNHITSEADSIFYVPGHTFNLISIDFVGGGDSVLKGSINGIDFVGGPSIGLTGLPNHIVFDASWHNLYAIDFCSYCITTFGNSNFIDNITFDVNVSGAPGPIAGAGLPGLLAGFGAMLAWYRRRRAAV